MVAIITVVIIIIIQMQLTFSDVYDIVLLGSRTQSVPSGKMPCLRQIQTHGSLNDSRQPHNNTKQQ